MHRIYRETTCQRLAPRNFSMPGWKAKTSSLIQFGTLGLGFVVQLKHYGNKIISGAIIKYADAFSCFLSLKFEHFLPEPSNNILSPSKQPSAMHTIFVSP